MHTLNNYSINENVFYRFAGNHILYIKYPIRTCAWLVPSIEVPIKTIQ